MGKVAWQSLLRDIYEIEVEFPEMRALLVQYLAALKGLKYNTQMFLGR
jgi:hypothetical protein